MHLTLAITMQHCCNLLTNLTIFFLKQAKRLLAASLPNVLSIAAYKSDFKNANPLLPKRGWDLLSIYDQSGGESQHSSAAVVPLLL